jgi:cell pole-organizing protein PopZ
MVTAQTAEISEMGEQRDQLISREVNNAVHAAFDALAQTVIVNNSRTLEDLVREMMQPILTVWLNDNLAGMVERLVRVEIERISLRGAMSPASRFTDRAANSF